VLTRNRFADCGRPRQPRGFTLIEMLSVLVLGAIVLGLVFAIGMRLERQLGDQAARLSTGEQLAAAAELLPLDMRQLSPKAGDIRSGQARDSSLEIRATVASAIVCGGGPGTLMLAPLLAARARRAASSIQIDDTLWLLVDADGAESWRPVRARAVRASPGSCAPFADGSGRNVFDAAHLIAADVTDSAGFPPGTMVRVTRPVRYSIYRSSDGRWYLGVRTWNAADGRFNSIQPWAGPYAPPGTSDHASRLAYYDSAGNVIASAASDTRGIARIEATMLGEPLAGGRLEDSLRIVVALRNRR
jgi:prepilin-type N-terminal cleavage/methylation domain-containing protein